MKNLNFKSRLAHHILTSNLTIWGHFYALGNFFGKFVFRRFSFFLVKQLISNIFLTLF